MEYPLKHLQVAPVSPRLTALASGCVEFIDIRARGMCMVRPGGGRVQSGNKLDYSVGLSRLCSVGDMVTLDQPLTTIHAANEADWDAAAAELLSAIKIGRLTDRLPAVYEKY